MKNLNDTTLYKWSVKNCKYRQLLSNSNDIKKIIESEKKQFEIEISFEELKFIEPAGMIMFFNLLENMERKRIKYTYKDAFNYSKSAISYGINLGFFQQIGAIQGSSHDEGLTYIAPQKVNIATLIPVFQSSNIDYLIYSEELAEKIYSKNFPCDLNINARKIVTYVIREIIRNVFEHSKSTHFCYASQRYPKQDKLEIAISDFGVGLEKTIPFDTDEIKNGKNTAYYAIKKAVMPGVTAGSNHSYETGSYRNSGFGINIVKKICERTKGSLLIATNNKAIEFRENKEIEYDCYFPGTVIRILIDNSCLSEIDFNDIVEEAIDESQGAIPSRISTILSIKDNVKIGC